MRQSSSERTSLQRVANSLRELEETLEAGLLPAARAWEELRSLPKPWAELAHGSLMELRSCGGSLLPTLRRLRGLAEAQIQALADAKAKAAQALAQAWVSSLLVPVLGAFLYLLLPGLSENSGIWLLFCTGAVVFSWIGAAWMLSLAERARWGGLRGEHRRWLLAAQCSGERFLALVRAGTPPDLAWNQMTEFLDRETVGLSREWGYSVFQSEKKSSDSALPVSARTIAQAGASMRQAIHVSLLEGRPCAERVESQLEALRAELRSGVERELALLGTRALKPLFLFVAPALLGLLGGAIWLAWGTLMGGL